MAPRKANVWAGCNRLNRLQGSWKSKHLSCSDASTWTYKMRNTSVSFNKKRRFTKKKGIHFSGMSHKSSAMIQMWSAPIGSCDWIFSCQLMALNWGWLWNLLEQSLIGRIGSWMSAWMLVVWLCFLFRLHFLLCGDLPKKLLQTPTATEPAVPMPPPQWWTQILSVYELKQTSLPLSFFSSCVWSQWWEKVANTGR